MRYSAIWRTRDRVVKKMRICFISRRFFPAISGMSVYALNLLHELVAAKHDVVMISQYRDDAAGAAVYGGGPPPPVPGVNVIGLASVGEQQVAFGQPANFEEDIDAMVAAAVREHAKAPFDIIHAQYAYPNGMAALILSRRLGIPCVVSIQGGDGHWVGACCRTHALAMQAVLSFADALLIGSASFAREVGEKHGTALSRLTVLPGATDTAAFTPLSEKPPGSLATVPVVLYHGRVDRRKGVMETIDAVAQLVHAGRALRFIISGIGPDLGAAKARANEKGISDVTEFTGYTSYENAPAIYWRGDIFVSPTYAEGFSNTILEAMASGLPIISTRVVGVVDCLSDRVNSLLVEPKEVAALATALTEVLDDAPLRNRLATAALREVREHYAWGPIGRRIIGVYEACLGKAPDPGWMSIYDPNVATYANADLSCRFRAAPHLL